ncbi:FKBP-type peptidyl-prolyl cis-trans isomerase [Natronosalvus halobius]|uniref:FKBP-type peptidyl-prolyl cis-trans isomerase n=1 Tax=Natronosalvus halobius TaxID=2953746 RepID=UPI00209C80E6|nr:FKBP-type peptidyl-prolyl cis-trans isomerase [Natronosalvus halobius]USZ72749.1 FKBP-type peptidyl-prolyl cis-trans isomerase [Natronosalvus halobius]
MVAPGRVAAIHFTGRIAEGDAVGEVFDTTDVDVALEEGIYHDHRDYKPLEVRVGEGKILPGIDRALREMAVGEQRTVELEPEEAFGAYSEERVLEVPAETLASDPSDLEPGTLVRDDNGRTGWIQAVEDDGRAVVDFNHELAGTTIECDLHVLAVSDDSTEATDELLADERSLSRSKEVDADEAGADETNANEAAEEKAD